MRYAFDNEAISYVNRIFDAAAQFPLLDYGKHDHTLMAVLWYKADSRQDDVGDVEEVTFETYNLLDKAYSMTISDPIFNSPMNDAAKEAEDCLMDARRVAADFESKFYIAETVTNALMVLDSIPQNTWNCQPMKSRVMEAFKADREMIESRIRDTLKSNTYYDELTRS